MNKIEVDPRLFVTCRLCLEDLGLYQIAPSVKEQILYCFDINVEPFDGLPQLICKKCEAILSSYTATKKIFIEKQNDLKNKIQASNNLIQSQDPPEPPTSPTRLGSTSPLFESKNFGLGIKRKRKACISSSSSDSDNEKPVKVIRNKNYSNEEIPVSWPKSYTKQYVCRICDSQWLEIKSLKAHIKLKHSALKKKYSNFFKRHCEVKLNKTDGKPNITGTSCKVMHSTEKITENVNPKYYIVYTTDARKDGEKHKAQNTDEENSNGYVSSDSSDIIIAKRKSSKRLCSRSSNETVVLDTANKSNTSDNSKESRNPPKARTSEDVGECINIDDSSDSEPENGKNASNTKTEKQLYQMCNEDLKADLVTVNEVATSSQYKYTKKHHEDFGMKSNKSLFEIATQLKRKILSIGRKIINKKSVHNYTPLFRFMEYKNLDVSWFHRSVVYVNLESNYVRVMSRVKNIREYADDEIGWIDYIPTANQTLSQVYGTVAQTNKSVNSVEFPLRESNKVPNGIDNTAELPSASVPEVELADSAVLAVDANLIGVDTKKLLNENPVANPKQLPKKSAPNETKAAKVIATKLGISNTEVTSQKNSSIEFCMPIITSTTSLAAPLLVHENDHEVVTTKNDAPRIKVKPVSELMSVETLTRMQEPIRMACVVSASQPMAIQNENNLINMYVPQMSMMSQVPNALQTNNLNTPVLAPDPTWKDDFMIMDTTELPNTRTNSPYQYFRRLLQLHNITLLDTDAELSKEFHCLIKFKVVYKQEINNPSVMLCLALFCSKNVFCLKIKDRNQDNLNLSKITPNWQWEVLKIYKGEVVKKLLDNAQKIGTEEYEFTNSFLCLLKSINLIKT